ncbi:hypothetical protein [Vampirovibrio sp.]|uniref:hypothetical protein n=1 Tax=Vampirovibrio sp. TaxID=2717857 RepID=UPI00359442A9
MLNPVRPQPGMQRPTSTKASPKPFLGHPDQFQRSHPKPSPGIHGNGLPAIRQHALQNWRLSHPTGITQASMGDSDISPVTRIVNPISFQRAEALLTALQSEGSPAASALLKHGPAEGLKKLLLISNRMVSDVNGLRKQGRNNVRFVFYLHDPRLKSFKDPEISRQNPDVADGVPVLYYFSKPEILQDVERIYRPLLHAGKGIPAPQPASPENMAHPMQHLSFNEAELQWLKKTAQSAGFQNNPTHFSHYLSLLFDQAEKLHQIGSAIPRQELGVLPLKLGIYSDNLPYLSYIKRGKRKEPPTRDLKGWQRLDDPKRHWEIHDITQLYPDCDLQGYHRDPAQHKLNLESLIPFWYEKNKEKG